MPLYYLILIALVQGITEFLPISSSAHLILLPGVMGETDQGLSIDIAVHVGTLAAVMLYFRAEVIRLVSGGLGLLGLTPASCSDRRLALAVLLATVPVVLAGGLVAISGATDMLRNIAVIGWASLGFGIVLWLADRHGGFEYRLDALRLPQALYIGLAQAVAIIPGASRAGMTMTMARALGFDRPSAARFSMLLAIPTIIAAGLLATLDLVRKGDAQLGLDALIAAALAFMAAYAAIFLFLRWVGHASLTPFVLYRVALGLVLLGIYYG